MTRDRLPKERMIRFVVGPDRQVIPDLAARLPGRGMWLSATADVLDLTNVKETGRPRDRQGGERQTGNRQAGDAANRLLLRAFARAARGPVSLPPDLHGVLQAGLVRRISDCVGLARRAGQAVAGFEKAREILRTGRSRLVLQASDGSEAEQKRFLSGFGVDGVSGSGPGIVVIDPLPGEVLGRIFGRDYVAHVAVAPGKLAESLVHEACRLAGLKNRSARAMGSARATEQETVPVNEVAGANE